MAIRELTSVDVRFALHCEPEYEPVEGNASAVDDATDRATEKWIRDQLRAGNEWAWCCAHVTAEWEDFVGNAHLGCCSYLSEEDFKAPGGYYAQMCQEALDDLNAKVIAAADRLALLNV